MTTIATVSCTQFGQKETSITNSTEAVEARSPSSQVQNSGILIDTFLDKNLAEAIEECSKRGMRLPTILELVTLNGQRVNMYQGTSKSLIDAGFKPVVYKDLATQGTNSFYYLPRNSGNGNRLWSISVDSFKPGEAKGLDLLKGIVESFEISNQLRVRCIQDNNQIQEAACEGQLLNNYEQRLRVRAKHAFENSRFWVERLPVRITSVDMKSSYKYVYLEHNNRSFSVAFQLKRNARDQDICDVDGYEIREM